MLRTPTSSAGKLTLHTGFLFVLALATALSIGFFSGASPRGFPAWNEIELLGYMLLGGNSVCLGILFSRGWHRFRRTQPQKLGPFWISREMLYILPSGVAAAFLMPVLFVLSRWGVSWVAAWVVTRLGSILIARAVDAVHFRTGLLRRRVSADETFVLILASAALLIPLALEAEAGLRALLRPESIALLAVYFVGTAFRLYRLGTFKNSVPIGAMVDDVVYLTVEQLGTSATLGVLIAAMLASGRGSDSWGVIFLRALTDPPPGWERALVAGSVFGLGSWAKVLLLLNRGRSTTFAVLLTQSVSTIAIVLAANFSHRAWMTPSVSEAQWIGFAILVGAMLLLGRTERQRDRDRWARVSRASAIQPRVEGLRRDLNSDREMTPTLADPDRDPDHRTRWSEAGREST